MNALPVHLFIAQPMASARLSTGAGIVLPSVDHAFGCALRCVGVARARPLRLLLTADVFDARLDGFLAMSSLPFLNRRHKKHQRGELAVMGGSPLLSVHWRYQGEIDHVSSTILA
jgi:hypothetical protein